MHTQISLARAAACLLLAAAGAHVHARQSAADPQASVPATRYQSALARHAVSAPTASPDANWVASNETVAATDSMALTMKAMPASQAQAADPDAGQASHAGHDMAPAAPADAHAGHAQHHQAAMQGMPGMGMNMDKKDSPAMCAPATGAGSKGMQCMSGDKDGDKAGTGKMSCCPSCCECCCKNKMKKDKEAS